MQQTLSKAGFEPGARVADRYEIRRVIGRGGMGEVYLAHDGLTGQDIALKTMHAKYAENRDAVARFSREVELARQLDHPGIVKLHDTHNWNGVLFYTMEHLDGKTLRLWLQERRRLDLASTVRVLCLVCDALEHAHRITIHRDLSPENIMVLPDGSVRLLDFGLAKLDDKFKGLTMAGTNLGKMMYMAPEQELDAAGVDHRADLYSLGVIFFEALVGRTPLPGRKITDFRPELAPETEKFVRKALARKPEERFASAREFKEALLRLYKLHKTRGKAGSGLRPGVLVWGGEFFRRVLGMGMRQAQFSAGRMRASSPGRGPGPDVPVQSEGGMLFQASDADDVFRSFFRHSGRAGDDHRLSETQNRLAAVYAANQAIASERQLSRVFDRILDQVFRLVPADTGVILLKGDNGDEPQIEYVRSKTGAENASVSTTIVRRAFERNEAVITRNALDDSRFRAGMSVITQNIASAMCVPLTHQEDRLGVIYVDSHGLTDAFTDSDLELLVALAGSAATAIMNARYVRMVEQSCQDTLLVLANAIELRDHYTVGHTRRVTSFAMEIARELGWDEAKLQQVQMGGVLHDVGKIAVDNAILGKPDRLTEEEFAKMRVHPARGAELLRDVKFLQPVIPYCLYHHERWDGAGYPFGLKGAEIPVEGRLVAVADTFDAMTSDRPYHKGMDPETALRKICEGKGTQFDPDMVDALEACHRKGSIRQVLQDYRQNEAHSIACPYCSTVIRLGKQAVAGGEVGCPVCHRRIRIRQQGCFYGELIVQA